MDTRAPSIEGTYTVLVHAQSFPFLPTTHVVRATFSVSGGAQPPIQPPPKEEDLLDKIKGLVTVAVVGGAVIGGLMLVNTVMRKR